MLTRAAAVPAHGVHDAPTIVLRGGEYFMAAKGGGGAVVLTPADSGLRFTAAPGETPVLSGAIPLSPQWAPLGANARGSKLVNAYRATLDGATALPEGVPALRRADGGRMTRARFPNSNPELDLFPAGYITGTTEWMTPEYNGTRCTSDRVECGKSVDVDQPAPSDEWHGMYQTYTVGVGGACDVYEPNYSPWCSSSFYRERWGEMHFRRPAGMQPNSSLLPHWPYKNATGGVVHAWRPGHWYTWMFEVASTTRDGKNITFGRGGNQGGEGNDQAGEWFIENVAEELDGPNEFFFDPSTRQLDVVVNGTGPPGAVLVPTLATLIELRGTQQAPVTNVSIEGITFTQTRPTFFEPRANPSGGDWALERIGVLLSEGAESLIVRGCNFTRLDGNAIMLSGYNRDAVIEKNHFEWLGQNAIASWGRSNFSDGTAGDFPRRTRVTDNWAVELGVVQKQSSFYFQALTAEAVLERNIVFNIPRAAINFNDGFGGGATMSQNLLFNTCRESSDHGAFNSWDRRDPPPLPPPLPPSLPAPSRLPYLTTVRNGTPSTIPAFNNITRNFIVANYAADGGCLDNGEPPLPSLRRRPCLKLGRRWLLVL